jgi:hypothetical protein
MFSAVAGTENHMTHSICAGDSAREFAPEHESIALFRRPGVYLFSGGPEFIYWRLLCFGEEPSSNDPGIPVTIPA